MKIEPIRPFFCHKVLPLEYDESLSYYEILCKLVHSLNLTIENVNQLGADFEALYNWVNNYFDNLDIQEEIDKKLDELIESGEFGLYLYSIIGFVTPTMFGAKGDGVTNDMPAFIEAMETGKNVKVLGGTYLLTGDESNRVRCTDQRVECLPDVTLQCNTPIELYNSEWYGGEILNDTDTGVILETGKCKIEKANINVTGAEKQGISCMQGTGIIDSCIIDGHSTANMGIWADYNNGENNQYVLQIHNCFIKNFMRNGIFCSAKCADIAYNLLDNNHIQTDPVGGGQIDVVGKQTQGYQIVRSNIIQNGGGYKTTGVELDWSASAEIYGNVINVSTTMLYGVVLQNASHASVHDNTIIGGMAIACVGDNSDRNILRTHNNWLASTTENVRITNQVSVVSLDEQRYEGDLITFTGVAETVPPVVDVNNGYIKEVTLTENSSVSLYVSGVHNLKFLIQRTVPVEGQPSTYITDVLVDGDNDIMATSSQSADFVFSNDVLTYTNGTLEQTVNVKIMTIN